MSSSVSGASQSQQAHIDDIVVLIQKYAPQLIMKHGDSKWTKGNLIFTYPKADPGDYVFMLGALKNDKISFHMMPYYAIKSLREKYNNIFSPYLSGKSCIHIDLVDATSKDAIIDIIERGTREYEAIWQEFQNKKSKK